MNIAKNNQPAIPIRLAILQRVCPAYRKALFTALSTSAHLEAKLFIGDDIPDSKVKSAIDLDGIHVTRLKTRFIRFGRRILPLHTGLIKKLREYKPDVILCEGESHFLGYLQAIFFRIFFSRRTALIHWCFISLPGDPLQKPGIESKIKAITRRFFDAFLLYSSYSKNCLTRLGVSPDRAFVATNVGDVKKFLEVSDHLKETRGEARKKLNLPERFTVLYTGTLDRNKKPELMLELAKTCDKHNFNFVLLGAGEMLHELQKQVEIETLENVFLPGRIVEQLPLYFRASDVLLIPGRGGIVISEAMAFGIPVITYQADGTEYDLVKNDDTGILLSKGGLSDFRNALEKLQANPELARHLGQRSRKLIEERFTTENMVAQIIKAANYARSTRNAAFPTTVM